MPYFQVPPLVLGDDGVFRGWAQDSIDIAHAAKQK